jgi:hypothetical protein
MSEDNREVVYQSSEQVEQEYQESEEESYREWQALRRKQKAEAGINEPVTNYQKL